MPYFPGYTAPDYPWPAEPPRRFRPVQVESCLGLSGVETPGGKGILCWTNGTWDDETETETYGRSVHLCVLPSPAAWGFDDAVEVNEVRTVIEVPEGQTVKRPSITVIEDELIAVVMIKEYGDPLSSYVLQVMVANNIENPTSWTVRGTIHYGIGSETNGAPVTTSVPYRIDTGTHEGRWVYGGTWVAGTPRCGIQFSDDNGATWTKAHAGVPVWVPGDPEAEPPIPGYYEIRSYTMDWAFDTFPYPYWVSSNSYPRWCTTQTDGPSGGPLLWSHNKAWIYSDTAPPWAEEPGPGWSGFPIDYYADFTFGSGDGALWELADLGSAYLTGRYLASWFVHDDTGVYDIPLLARDSIQHSYNLQHHEVVDPQEYWRSYWSGDHEQVGRWSYAGWSSDDRDHLDGMALRAVVDTNGTTYVFHADQWVAIPFRLGGWTLGAMAIGT